MLSKYLVCSKCSINVSLLREQSSSLARLHLCYLSERRVCHFPAVPDYFHTDPWARINLFVFVFVQRWMNVPRPLLDCSMGFWQDQNLEQDLNHWVSPTKSTRLAV